MFSFLLYSGMFFRDVFISAARCSGSYFSLGPSSASCQLFPSVLCSRGPEEWFGLCEPGCSAGPDKRELGAQLLLLSPCISPAESALALHCLSENHAVTSNFCLLQ